MGEKPSQRVLLWSQLDMWHYEPSERHSFPEGRYNFPSYEAQMSLAEGRFPSVTCRMCGCLVDQDFMSTHDAYHEEQGY